MTVGGRDYWLEWLHPRLPTGLNSWMINGDEVDGPGVNEPFEGVTYFETLEVYPPIVMTDALIKFFDEHCPDYVVPRENNVICIRGSGDMVVVRAA